MEKELVFHVLKIPPTSDESEIRSAYRTLLKSVNPEDDPESFKRLRQAYEEALVLARLEESQSEKDSLPKSETDLWLSQAENLYQDISLRHREDLWEELLSNPLCDGLDTSLETREKMLVFLMDHSHLPHSIWKMIDDTFLITENFDTLKEQYPVNFLNYLRYYAENDTFLPFEFFVYKNRNGHTSESSKPEAQSPAGNSDLKNADAYINTYYNLKSQLDNDNGENAAQILDDIPAYGVYHPFEDVERLRYCLAKGQLAEAQSLASYLQTVCPDNNYVRLYLGEAEWAAGNKEEAYNIWESILSEIPDHYTAKLNTVRYLIDTKDYYNARQRIMDLLEVNSNDEKIGAFLKTANEALIAQFRETLASGREDSRLPGGLLTIELCWCLLQNERSEEALELIEKYTPAESEEYSYHNLYGKLLHQSGKYSEALPHLEKWLELIKNLTDDGAPETAKRMSRLPEAYFIIGSCYYELGQQEPAILALQNAIEAFPDSPRRLECMQYLAHALLTFKQYENAVDACDGIIAKNDSYYPAYLVRQEAFFELKRAQEVIDDYYNAVNIYPIYHRPYLLAAEVFVIYAQYEDADKVFSRAIENNVEFSPRMKLVKVQVKRNLAASNEERNNALKILEELQKLPESDDNDIEDRSLITLEICLLHWDNDELKTALDYIKKALKEKPDNERYHFICAGIHLDMHNYKKALAEYDMAAKAYQESPALYFNRGLCYDGLGYKDLAARTYETAVEKEDGYRDAYIRLSDYYSEKYTQQYKPEDLDRSIYYISQMIALYPQNARYYMHRGRLYYRSLLLEPAIADFEKIIELTPEDGWAWNNMACCYQCLGQFDKAIEMLKKAISYMGKDKSALPYSNMADCYASMADYENAAANLEKAVSIASDNTYYWERLGDSFDYIGAYDKALDAYEHTRNEKDYYENIAYTYLRQGQMKKCLFQFIKGYFLAKSNSDGIDQLYNLGSIYMDAFCDYRKAVFFMKKAVRSSSDPSDLFLYEKNLAMAYYLWGKSEKAKKHALNALEHFKKTNQGTIEDYIAYRPKQIARAGIFAKIYMCLGEDEKALYYLQMMGQANRCIDCRLGKCYEQSLFTGMYYLGKGNLTAALAEYTETVSIHPHSIAIRLQLEYIKKKLNIQPDS